MHYVAIDLHKRYSVRSALNEQGQPTREGRVDGNHAAGFAQFIHGLEGPCKVEENRDAVFVVLAIGRKATKRNQPM